METQRVVLELSKDEALMALLQCMGTVAGVGYVGLRLARLVPIAGRLRRLFGSRP